MNDTKLRVPDGLQINGRPCLWHIARHLCYIAYCFLYFIEKKMIDNILSSPSRPVVRKLTFDSPPFQKNKVEKKSQRRKRKLINVTQCSLVS